jgi:hypothetical protein
MVGAPGAARRSAASLRQQISPRRIKIRPRIKPTPYTGFFYTTEVPRYFSIGIANSMGAEGEKRGVDRRSSGGGNLLGGMPPAEVGAGPARSPHHGGPPTQGIG